jgi:hypothetical protein
MARRLTACVRGLITGVSRLASALLSWLPVDQRRRRAIPPPQCDTAWACAFGARWRHSCARLAKPIRARAPCDRVCRVLSAMCRGLPDLTVSWSSGDAIHGTWRCPGTLWRTLRLARTRRCAPSTAFVRRPDVERPSGQACKGQGPEQPRGHARHRIRRCSFTPGGR